MYNDLMNIELQLHAIVNHMNASINKLAVHQIIQCALYNVRGHGNNPHAKLVEIFQHEHPSNTATKSKKKYR